MGYGVGTTLSGIVYFREVGALIDVPPPKGSFREAFESHDVASGGSRYLGRPYATWHWDFFRAEWYDILRGICQGSSGIVYISTTINDNLDEFRTFRCRHKWPLDLDKDSHRRMDFNVVFRRCIYTPAFLTVTVSDSIALVASLPNAPTIGLASRAVTKSESITITESRTVTIATLAVSVIEQIGINEYIEGSVP